MLAGIVPRGVAVAEVFDHRYDSCPLLPAEEAAVSLAGPKRRGEFAAVRACARRALAEAGLPAGPIVPGPSGAPAWPAGVTGSMTHCAGYRGCAVGPAEQFLAIGVDAEPHRPLPDGVLAMVAGSRERTALAGYATAVAEVCWDTILFSAKESVFKAWFPATGRWLGFRDAELGIDQAGTFTARLPGPAAAGAPVTAYRGRWAVGRGLVVTAVVVPAG